jgi:hypothetical protein
VWTGFIWLRWKVAGCCEHGNEHWGSIKCGYLLSSWRNVGFSNRGLFHGAKLLLGLNRRWFIALCCCTSKEPIFFHQTQLRV